MKIERSDDAGRKAYYKVVRRDDYRDLDGVIVYADEETGEACMFVNDAEKTHSLGAGGLKIIRRGR